MGQGVATPKITRLTSSVWLVSAIGERKSGTKSLATRSVAQLYRLNQASFPVNAGLTAIGKVTVGGNSEVSGYDVTPPNWLVGSPPSNARVWTTWPGSASTAS